MHQEDLHCNITLLYLKQQEYGLFGKCETNNGKTYSFRGFIYLFIFGISVVVFSFVFHQ